MRRIAADSARLFGKREETEKKWQYVSDVF